MDIPNNLQKEINIITKKYSQPPNLLISLYYLSKNCFYCMMIVLITLFLHNYINSYILFIGYSISMGTTGFGIWVLGHECGHGAFGRTPFQNDFFGYILHSSILVPYFSWKYSHNKHHKYTNHLILDEAWVPQTKKEAKNYKLIFDTIGEDSFSIVTVIIYLLFGWQLYLFGNCSGGKVMADLKTPIDKDKYKDHFHSGSQVMPDDLGWRIELSTAGCLFTLYQLWYYLGWSSFYWYFGPYTILNAWLIIYTWLQHTHPDIPHYGPDSFTFLKGALSTVDRPYPALLDHLHHHLGTTHVAHHINYSVPHYRAKSFTRDLKNILGKYYNYDPTPIIYALFNISKTCHYVDSTNGIQHFKSFSNDFNK